MLPLAGRYSASQWIAVRPGKPFHANRRPRLHFCILHLQMQALSIIGE